MKFKSNKDTFFKVVVIGLFVVLTGFVTFNIIKGVVNSTEYVFLALVFGIALFLLWSFFKTHYELTENELIFTSGLISRKININRIKEIVVGGTIWIGNWPATAKNGLIIKYDDYGLLNISPQTNETFIEYILKLNKDIVIKPKT